MDASPPPKQVVRFGDFEANLRAGELRRNGLKVKLGPQSFQVLGLLLETPGEVVTREELRQKLWSEDTFVDFEAGLNSAIKRLRDALADDADAPRFIETLPRHGYRFIAPAERYEPTVAAVLERPTSRKPLWLLGAAAAALLLGLLVGFNTGGLRDRLLGAGPPRIESVAVLPLENLTGDPGQEYFVDGMTDALITNLAQVRSLRVISRTSVMRYKGTNKSLPEIAQELKVDAVVEGAVARSGDRVRVTAQLIHARTDRHLWAEEYERDLRNILTLQSELARAIAGQIQVTLTPQEQARLARAHPVNPEAYQAYLYGRFHLAKRSEEGMRKALDYFQQAAALAPGWALGYAGEADARNLLASFGHVPPREAYPRAKAAALKALELDGTLAEAHTALAAILASGYGNYAQAEKHYQRALQLNPGYAQGHHWYSRFLSAMERHEEALRKIKRAQELDPFSLIVNDGVGLAYFWARQYDQAIAEYKRTLEMDPDFARTRWNLGRAYEQQGRPAEAFAEYVRWAELTGFSPEAVAAMKQAHAASGLRGFQQVVVARLHERSRRRYVSPMSFAYAYASMGDKEQALVWLEKAYAERNDGLLFLNVVATFDPLRADPRFQDLVRRMKFPPATAEARK